MPGVRGRRRRTRPTVIEPFLAYCRARLADDPHLWASTLLDELVGLGFTGSYPSLTAAIREHRLRPHREPCQATRGRDVAIIAHPAGEETQWDSVELPDPPAAWGLGRHAHLLVGALAHSGRWRAVLAEAEDFPHLVEALDAVVRKLGGVPRVWRFDRMATVCSPASGRITAAFAQVAKHYGVRSVVCPPRRGNRKGVVEKANHSAAQRWSRTLADDATVTQAQAGVDRLAVELDGRRRVRDGPPATVAELAADRGAARGPGRGVPGRVRRRPRGHRAGLGRVPRQLLLGATGPGRRAGPGPAPARGRHTADRHRARRDRRHPPASRRRRGTGHPGRGARRRTRTGRARRFHLREALHPQDTPSALGGGEAARPSRDRARSPRRDRPVRLRGHRRPSWGCSSPVAFTASRAMSMAWSKRCTSPASTAASCNSDRLLRNLPRSPPAPAVTASSAARRPSSKSLRSPRNAYRLCRTNGQVRQVRRAVTVIGRQFD
ncbi:integrase-like protein [Saccharothrix carnea]|uniref:Integrase-like protein n=1 Tax=Saccharothrix carnea TaxID=1280637 RepID=A0A2P8IF54_SACCR|nr:integrase-like protein [Saccharothrix carnea]